MAKGRKPIQVDKQQIQALIYKVEATQTFPTRQHLWEILAIELAKELGKEKISTTFVYNKCMEFNCEIKTDKGKRGGEGGDFGRSKGIKPQGSRKRKGMSPEASAKIYDNLPQWANQDRALKLLERAESGSSKAMVALKCLDCVLWSPKEIRMCQSFDCSLYSIRPYQGQKAMEGEEQEMMVSSD
jgi:hypothetical protein